MKTLAELEQIRGKTFEKEDNKVEKYKKITVGMATCGIAAGARPVLSEFIDQLNKNGLYEVKITMTGCNGMCKLEPIVEVTDENGEKTTYIKMTPDKVKVVVNKHIMNNIICEEYKV